MMNSLREKSDLTKRLSSYAASAGVLAMIGSSASAQVVYSGSQNIQLHLPEEYAEIDLDGDMVYDFAFGIYGSSYFYSTFPYYYSGITGYAFMYNLKTDGYKNSWMFRTSTIGSYYSTNYGTTYLSIYPIVSGLLAGDGIHSSVEDWSNASYPYWAGALGVGSFTYSYYSISYQWSYTWQAGDFVGDTRYVGVRFYIGTEQHYGWIRVNVGDFIDPLTIVDWAYESYPGYGIIAGDTEGDFIAPVLNITGAPSTTTNQTIALTLSASEPVRGFTAEGILVTNGVAANLMEVTPGLVYTLDIIASDYGDVFVDLLSGAFLDLVGNPSSSASVSWEYIDSSLDIDKNSGRDLLLYPNPVSDVLYIEPQGEAAIKLFDMKGNLVEERQKAENHAVDVNGYEAGIYILEIRTEDKVCQHKIQIE